MNVYSGMAAVLLIPYLAVAEMPSPKHMLIGLSTGRTEQSLTEQYQKMALHLESTFPELPYLFIIRSCNEVWHSVRSCEQPSSISWQDALIEGLYRLDTRLKTSLRTIQSFSADDKENLLEIIHQMHVEYVNTQKRNQQDDGLAIRVSLAAAFFNLMKERLRQSLASDAM